MRNYPKKFRQVCLLSLPLMWPLFHVLYLSGRNWMILIYHDDDEFRFDDDDEFRFNDASTHEGHLRQNGELTWFCSETIIMISHKCIKCKTRTNLKIKAVILC